MYWEHVFYVELDDEAYWQVVDLVPTYADIKVIYDINGNEYGVIVTSAVSDTITTLNNGGYINVSEINYDVIIILNIDKMI